MSVFGEGSVLSRFTFLCSRHSSGWRLKDSSQRPPRHCETTIFISSESSSLIYWSEWKKLQNPRKTKTQPNKKNPKQTSKQTTPKKPKPDKKHTRKLPLFTIALWSCWHGIKYMLAVSWENSASKGVLMLQGKASKTQQMPSIESVARVKFIIIVHSKWNAKKLWKNPKLMRNDLFQKFLLKI